MRITRFKTRNRETLCGRTALKLAILATAYSITRGYKSKGEGPLDMFHTLVWPHIGSMFNDNGLTIMD